MELHTSKQIGAPIYAALAERLRRAIREGKYLPGQLLGSEHELSRQESISRVTVRRASQLLVGEGLLERRPGKGLYVRASVGQVSTRLVQLVAGNLQWDSCMRVSRGVQSVAKQRGIQIQMYDAHGDMELDLAMVRQLPATAARGAIVVALHSAAFSESVYHLHVQGFPFVLVDQCLQDIDVPSVTADNYSGGYQAGKALVELGHQRIAFIGDLIATTVRDRLSGMRDAIADAGLPFDRSLILDLLADKDRLGDWSERVEVCIRDVMGRPSPPTAMFFSCDAVARPAYRALTQMGVRIPQDVSLIGFDDDPLAEWLNPSLTTVRQSFEVMGQTAMELLVKRMADPSAVVEHRVLPVELIRRDSVAPRSGVPVELAVSQVNQG